MLTDIEIAQSVTPRFIGEIAEKAGIPEEYLELYGRNKAKIDLSLMKDSEKKRTLLIGKEQIKYIQKMAALGVDKEMYKNCVIKGNKAEVTVFVKDPISAVEVTGKYTLIKKNGKWLIQSIKMDAKK